MLRLDDLPDLHLHRAADALAVEVTEQMRLGPAHRPEVGVPGPRLHELLLPLGRVGQRRVRPEPDHRVPYVVVAVVDVDVRSARLVRLADECTPQVRVLHHREDEDLLPRLHVGSDADGELRVPLEAFVHRKDPMHIAR